METTAALAVSVPLGKLSAAEVALGMNKTQILEATVGVAVTVPQTIPVLVFN
jgi:hypothetical protein